MALSQSVLQMQLAKDTQFLNRMQYLMLQYAREVKMEAATVPYHGMRSSYASMVMSNPQMAASAAAPTVVGGINLIGTVTIEDSGVVTSADDPTLWAQIVAYWNLLAGVDSATPPQAEPPTFAGMAAPPTMPPPPTQPN